jgi:hypothetical protein
MSEFYQIALDNKNDKDYVKWEKLNFILRRIFDAIGNLTGSHGTIINENSMDMSGNPIIDGPIQKTAKQTDFITKSYLSSLEFGRLILSLISSVGSTPLQITGSPGTPSSGGGGGGVPLTRLITAIAPITGGGDLSADRTIGLNQAGITHGNLSGLVSDDHLQYLNRSGIREMTGAFKPATIITLVDAATVATDASLGNTFVVIFGGNRLLGNPTNPTDGQRIIWLIYQDGTGNRTILLDSKFAAGIDTPPIILSTDPGVMDIFTAFYVLARDQWIISGFLKGY